LNFFLANIRFWLLACLRRLTACDSSSELYGDTNGDPAGERDLNPNASAVNAARRLARSVASTSGGGVGPISDRDELRGGRKLDMLRFLIFVLVVVVFAPKLSKSMSRMVPTRKNLIRSELAFG